MIITMFQFYYSSINTKNPVKLAFKKYKFQFYYSSINTKILEILSPVNLRFNSTIVRLTLKYD